MSVASSPGTGTPTATAKGIDTVQANSRVQAWALILKDALETAWQFHAKWMGLTDQEPVVQVNTDYGLTLTASEMADLLKMRAMRELSLKTMWLEAKRRGILSPTFDPEEEEQRLMEEGRPLALRRGSSPASMRARAASIPA